MQWILFLVGLVLGWVFDESFWGAIVGALAGLGLGLTLRVGQLNRRLERTEQSLEFIQQRLTTLEPSASVTEPQPPAAQAPPELTWDLPSDDAWVKPTVTTSAIPEQAPHAPNLIERAITAAHQWLVGGNTVLRVGVVLLFLGLAFLLRYATEGVVISLEVRYAGVAASALALLALGWWLRTRNANYALILQGTGVGVLYLTIFAAMRLHTLIDPSLAFGLLVVITVFSGILAVTQNALGLAAAAALGGFAAPILTSTGAGSHVALFSYFALLNAGIFAIAWFKAWRLLNLIGFVGTFGIGFAWGLRAYTPELFWSTEPFLILFFLMYLAIGLLFARRKLQELSTAPEDDSREAMLRWSARQGDYVDGSILFGPPIVGFGLQFALVEHVPFGAAYSALALGLLYIGLAKLLARRAPGRALLLVETCLALSVVFGSLAIPLGLDARWTSAAWAVEGAAVFWLGLRQQRTLARIFGLLLQFGAGVALFGDWLSVARDEFWTPLIVALAAMTSAWMQQKLTPINTAKNRRIGAVLLAWAAAWWAVALINGVQRFAAFDLQIPALLLLSAASVALWAALALRLRWPGLAVLCTLLMPACSTVLLVALNANYHPFAQWGWLAWAAVLAVHGLSLRRLPDLLPRWAASAAHVIGCWLIISVLALELRFALMQLSEHYNAWRWLGWALLPSAYLLLMAAPRTLPWPIENYTKEYRVWVAAPLAVLMLVWFWLANIFSDGAADPLPYLPLINPLELGLFFALAGVVVWMRSRLTALGVTAKIALRSAQLVAGICLFALFTAMVMRTAHHWSGVPYVLSDLLASMRVQAGLSIVWTLMALALMVGGHVRGRREIWIAGAALIGVVVAKLFFVELSDRGGLERIISFIGVGVLLLVVGYFSPLPPKPAQTSVS
ncbi:DUF2339 domain-containing protein [Pseudomonas sp.]|uniref:DUF2339 domain-containing protein n=1 Tax=Pseudomonas sp. TaxID=306 RepID=UPI0026033E90|nr:DUF2339 domain-containing protein [Pseudomonas sp.]